MSPNLFKTQVNGIPCYCRVDHYSPGTPDTFTEEGCDEEFNYTMLDENKAPAPHIEAQMTEEDIFRMLEEYQVTRLEFKHYIED